MTEDVLTIIGTLFILFVYMRTQRRGAFTTWLAKMSPLKNGGLPHERYPELSEWLQGDHIIMRIDLGNEYLWEGEFMGISSDHDTMILNKARPNTGIVEVNLRTAMRNFTNTSLRERRAEQRLSASEYERIRQDAAKEIRRLHDQSRPD